MLRMKFIALGTAGFLTLGGGVAVGVLGSGAAGAAGTIHNQTGMVNSSLAVEGKAALTFSCDDSTGKYKIAFSNVQVITSDKATEWSTLEVDWSLYSPDKLHSDGGAAKLVQNSSSGLFNAKQSGYLKDIKSCVTGGVLAGTGAGTLHDLFLVGNLT